MKIDIGIATSDRKDVLRDIIMHLGTLSPLPDNLIICPAHMDHVDQEAARSLACPLRIISGARGLPAQRNAILNDTDADILIFLDDDFLPAGDFVGKTAELFSLNPKIVVATGHVIADGIIGPGFETSQGLDHLRNDEGFRDVIEPVFNAYGCNMILRMEPIRQHRLQFDETLPLYGWLEDVDFSRQLAPYGRIVRASRLRGVHLGTKRSGRTPGRKLGYSQIANRVYLARKGSIPWIQAVVGMSKNVAANILHWHSPEPWVDRRGRLSGNIMAVSDWVLGRVRPEKILSID